MHVSHTIQIEYMQKKINQNCSKRASVLLPDPAMKNLRFSIGFQNSMKLFYKSLFAHQFLQLEGFFLVIFTWNLPGSCDQPVQEQVDEAGGGHCGPILGPRLAIYVICCQTAPAIYKVTINQTYFWIYLKPFICHIFYITF